MIKNIQIIGDPDLHPEKPIYDANELASGKIDLSKLNVKGHHVKVFDLMCKDQVSEYEKLYVALSAEARAGKILVTSNTREILSRSDGSTGWFKFIEWTEFDTSEILGVQ